MRAQGDGESLAILQAMRLIEHPAGEIPPPRPPPPEIDGAVALFTPADFPTGAESSQDALMRKYGSNTWHSAGL